MALLEDMLESGTGTGLALGIGAIILAPTLLPTIGKVLRPAAKAVIKGGMTLYRETAAGIGEAAGDLMAEVRAELDQEATAGATASGGSRASRSSESHKR